MAAIPPPQGINDADYDTIEAAVTETVRGRWFLSEFARRNRLAETRQLLDSMARIEAAVLSGPPALPSADPSVRLLIQRIKEIAGQLGILATDMRNAGVEAHYADAVEQQGRAVAGMMRSSAPGKIEPPAGDPLTKPDAEAPRTKPHDLAPRSQPHDPIADPPVPRSTSGLGSRIAGSDPRLAALSELDRMSPAEKLALFT